MHRRNFDPSRPRGGRGEKTRIQPNPKITLWGDPEVGWGSKLHILCDGAGNPLHFHVSAGQAHDASVLDTVLVGADAALVVATLLRHRLRYVYLSLRILWHYAPLFFRWKLRGEHRRSPFFAGGRGPLEAPTLRPRLKLGRDQFNDAFVAGGHRVDVEADEDVALDRDGREVCRVQGVDAQ